MRTSVFQIMRIALHSLRKNVLRAFLLWLTTAIGIAGVVSVVSVVKGGTSAFRGDMSRLGIDLITFTDTGSGDGQKPLTAETFEDVKREFAPGGARFSLAQIDLQQKVVAPSTGMSAPCAIMEIDENFLGMFGLRISEGEGFGAEHFQSDEPLCLIDRARARELFGDASPVGRQIEIKFLLKSLVFTVIGVVEDPMTLRQHIERFDTGSLSRELATQHLVFKNVYVMRGAYKRSLSVYSVVREIPLMLVKPPDVNKIDEVHEGILSFLKKNGVRCRSYTMNRWLDSIAVTTQRIDENSNMVWVIILGVSAVLIVLVNYLAVREKFREIAIRRVEGASRPAVVAQMAAESLLVSLLAGAAGILIGVGIAHALCAWVVEWPPVFTAGEMALAMGLALFVGMIATVLPALRAAQVDPAATLRYE